MTVSSGQVVPSSTEGEGEQFALQLVDVRMTLAHRVIPDPGRRPILARHWFKGGVAVAESRLMISSAGLLLMDLHNPTSSPGPHLHLDLPTPACLELMIDADVCTRQLHGFWELRIFTGEAERLAVFLGWSAEDA